MLGHAGRGLRDACSNLYSASLGGIWCGGRGSHWELSGCGNEIGGIHGRTFPLSTGEAAHRLPLSFGLQSGAGRARSADTSWRLGSMPADPGPRRSCSPHHRGRSLCPRHPGEQSSAWPRISGSSTNAPVLRRSHHGRSGLSHRRGPGNCPQSCPPACRCGKMARTVSSRGVQVASLS